MTPHPKRAVALGLLGDCSSKIGYQTRKSAKATKPPSQLGIRDVALIAMAASTVLIALGAAYSFLLAWSRHIVPGLSPANPIQASDLLAGIFVLCLGAAAIAGFFYTLNTGRPPFTQQTAGGRLAFARSMPSGILSAPHAHTAASALTDTSSGFWPTILDRTG